MSKNINDNRVLQLLVYMTFAVCAWYLGTLSAKLWVYADSINVVRCIDSSEVKEVAS